MSKFLLTLLAAVSFSAVSIASSAYGSELESATSPNAANVPVFGTFHDRETGFVFVRLPDRWVFVANDTGTPHHPVFHDPATDFVFVRMASGWVFVGKAAGSSNGVSVPENVAAAR